MSGNLHSSKRRGTFLLAGTSILSLATAAHALVIIPTFDSSIDANLSTADAASYKAAINYADAQIASYFSDPITINITYKSNPGTSIFGQSGAPGTFVGNYSHLVSLLTADAKTPDDFTAIANLPATDPTNGTDWLLINAQAKALGVLPANGTEQDGTVTLGAGFNYTYDPLNRAVPGKSDFIGVAEHEISEVMGRYGTANLNGSFGPLDLFGYQFGPGGTGTGVLNLAPNQDNNYFSIDGGKTPLKLYNNHINGEDDKDWGPGSNDAFNAFSGSGVENAFSPVDIREMDVIGYDAVVPEPATLGTAAAGCVLLVLRRRRRSV